MSSPIPEGMIRLGEPVPTRTYLRQLWDRRDYLREVPLQQVRSAHLDTVLGNLWHLINPALQMAIYFLVFGVMLGTDRGVDNFILFLTLGMLPFRWFANTVQAGAIAITGNIGLIRAIRFPRAVLPLSVYIEKVIGFLPSLAVMLMVAIVTGESLSFRWLLAVLPLVSIALTGLGGTFIAARLTHQVGDVRQLLPFLFRLMFYVSGILYLPEAFIDDDNLLTLFAVNPAYSAISGLRWAIMDTALRPEHIVSMIVWPLVLMPLGFAFFRRAEEDYGRG
ncbi:MAG: ABC transporter permease [Actinomycetota bacterium]